MLSLLAILGFLGGILALYLIKFPYQLIRNYIKARKTGLPIIIVPIDQNHLVWMLTGVSLRPTFKVSLTRPVVWDLHVVPTVPSMLTRIPEVSTEMDIRKTRHHDLRMGVPQRTQAFPTTRQARQRYDLLPGHLWQGRDRHARSRTGLGNRQAAARLPTAVHDSVDHGRVRA